MSVSQASVSSIENIFKAENNIMSVSQACVSSIENTCKTENNIMSVSQASVSIEKDDSNVRKEKSVNSISINKPIILLEKKDLNASIPLSHKENIIESKNYLELKTKTITNSMKPVVTLFAHAINNFTTKLKISDFVLIFAILIFVLISYLDTKLIFYLFALSINVICTSFLIMGLFPLQKQKKYNRVSLKIKSKHQLSKIGRKYKSSKIKFKPFTVNKINFKSSTDDKINETNTISNDVIKYNKQHLGLEPYMFDIFYEKVKLRFELDSGACSNIISKQYLKQKVPDFHKYFYKKTKSSLHSVTGHNIKCYGLFRIPFFLPKYGEIVLDCLVTDSIVENCFLLGRDFIKSACVAMVYDDSINSVKLEYNRLLAPKIKVNDHITFSPRETKTIVGKIINNKQNTNYKIKNSSSCPLIYKQTFKENNDVYISATNKLNFPVSHKITSITLIENKISKLNNTKCFYERLLCSKFLKYIFPFMSMLYTYLWIAIINIKLTYDDIIAIFPNEYICKATLAYLSRYKCLVKILTLTNTESDTNILNKVNKLINIPKTILSNVIDENEFFESFQNDLDIGLNMSDVLQTKIATLHDIKESITCQFEHAKSKIANLLYDLQIYSKHTFDCGTLNESFIPKMSVKLTGPVFRNTKPYSLKPSDKEAVDKFFDLLLQNGYAEIAPPHMSFGNPVFTVPSRSEDGSNLPRIIIDAKYSNEAAFGGSSAALPDYKNLLGPIIKKAKYVTTIDLKKCFYSILVDQASIESGAMNVLTEKSAYIMKRALTGFCQTPSYLTQTLQKFLHLNEKGELDFIQNLLVFMDDLILYSESDEDLQNHIMQIEKLLKRLHLIGVKVSTSKCTIAFDLDSDQEIHILGYKIKKRKLLCPDKKLKEITTLGDPDSLKKMQSLLGKINYYRSIFPLSVHEQCNLLYKKLNPFIYDDEAKAAFLKIKELLSKTERFIDVSAENSVNVLLTDASHYSVGSVLLNVNMSECIKTFPINSHNLDSTISHPYPKDTEYIHVSENIIESIFKTARKLNHRSFPEDLIGAMTHLFTILNLYDFDLIEFLPYDNKKECLSTLHKNIFNKNISQFDTTFLLENETILTYLLYGFSKMLKANIILSTPCSTIKVGTYAEDISFLIHNSLVYGLNVKTPNDICNKTLLRFSANLMTLAEFKNYFLGIIKNNSYETNKNLVRIISFYSKAIPMGCLEKLGIAYLEIFSVYASLKYYEPQLTNRVTFLLLDSMVVKGILTRQKFSSRSVKIDNLANKLYFWYKGTALYFIHVSDKQNLADIWSRLCPIEISTFNNSVKPYYTDEYLTISEFIKTIKQHPDKLPHIGKYFTDKFKEYFSTPNFIQLQLKEKNCPDSLPHTIKYIKGKILLPQILYLPYICFIHYSLMHLGTQRLWNYVNNYYYFNNKKLAKLICDNLTANCLLCIQNKPSSLRLKEGFTFNNSINAPNKLIYSDLLELPTFENKIRKQDPKAMLVIKDVYSKYTSIYILQNKTSRAIINCLSNYFSVHDIPTSFISDNASIYKSALIMNFFKNLNIKVLNSSVLKSKSRGFIERAVRTVNEMIRFYREKYTKLDLSHILSISCAMLNKIPFLKEKLSPYNLQFNSLEGVMDGEFKDPTDNIFQYKLNDNLDLYTKEYKAEVEKLIAECRDRVVKYKLKISNKRNKNRINHNISVNDLVFTKINDKGYEYKYRPLYGLVPYKVVEKHDYTIHIENQISKQVVMRHASDLKRINFDKLSKLSVDDMIAKSFKLLTTNNINDLFDIPIAVPRNLNKKQNNQSINSNSDSSSSDDDSNDDKDIDFGDSSILDTIIEEN